MRIYVAIDFTREVGPNLSADDVRETLEAELPDHLEVQASYYAMVVAGSGSSVKELQESIKLRRSA